MQSEIPLAQTADSHYIKAMSDPAVPRFAPCPICGKPAAQEALPFCSKRCKDVDLHRWFSGKYAVPVVEDEDEDGMAGEGGPPLAPKDER
jgi:endogenous inhibitor of DNA gyrase (YacG/DUF329 family)